MKFSAKVLLSFLVVAGAAQAQFFYALPPTDTLPHPGQPGGAASFCGGFEGATVEPVLFLDTDFGVSAKIISEVGSNYTVDGDTLNFVEGRAIIQAKRPVTVKVGGYDILLRGGAALYVVTGEGRVIAVNVLDFWRGSVKIQSSNNSESLDVGSALFVSFNQAPIVDRVSLSRLIVKDALIRSVYRSYRHEHLMNEMLKVAAAQCTVR